MSRIVLIAGSLAPIAICLCVPSASLITDTSVLARIERCIAKDDPDCILSEVARNYLLSKQAQKSEEIGASDIARAVVESQGGERFVFELAEIANDQDVKSSPRMSALLDAIATRYGERGDSNELKQFVERSAQVLAASPRVSPPSKSLPKQETVPTEISVDFTDASEVVSIGYAYTYEHLSRDEKSEEIYATPHDRDTRV